MSTTLDSHAYADRLEALADFLRSRPAFKLDSQVHLTVFIEGKDDFLAAVRAVGPGDKIVEFGYLKYRPTHNIDSVTFSLNVSRDRVCRKVQDEKWECEPLLTPEEEAQLAPEVR